MAIAVRSAQTTWLGMLAAGSGVLRSASSAIDEHRVSSRFAMALALILGGRGVWAERLDVAAQHSGGVFRFVGEERP